MEIEERYEFLEKIGTGSYATVYRARDNKLGREVAIKQIHDQFLDNPEQLDRYWKEAQLLASLQHPNIVTIFDIDRDRGWLILELMQSNLAERMAGRQMDLRALRTTLAHSLRALKYLHARGIVHGDVKLSNMMIDARRRVKLGDFGLARRVSDDEGSLLKGTTKYMAPEVVSEEFGEVGPASDLYSLGFASYELMCGQNFETLFPGLSAFGRNKQIAWMMWHAAPDRKLPEIPRVLEGVPDDLARVIQKLCEKDQSRRYASADEALSDLNIDVKVVKKDEPYDAELSEPGDKTTDRKRQMLVAGAFAVSLVLSLLMLLLPTGSGSGDPNEPHIVYGVVREIDVDRNSIVIEDVETGIPEEFELGRRPRIFLRNIEKNILLRELQPGDRLEIEEKTDETGTNLVVTAARPVTTRGRIMSKDDGSSKLVVAVEEGENRDDLQLRVPERAKILLNKKPTRLRDLREGDRVVVTHLPETGGQAGRVLDKLAASRMAEAVGFVADVDPVKRRLTIRFGKSKTSASALALPVAADCRISFRQGAAAVPTDLKLSGLKTNDRVKFRYDTEFHVIEVTRDQQQIAGSVQKVMLGRNHLVVSTPQGTRLTFVITDSCEVTLSRKAAELADLRRYDEVEITYDDSSGGHLPASTLFARRPSRRDRLAVVIGPESYSNSFVTPLPYAGSDANRFRDSLLSRYAFDDDRILMLRDESPQTMQKNISDLLQRARSQTQVLVYVSGHAYVDDDDRVDLAGESFNWDKMSETGLSLDWLVRQLNDCSALEKILLLDSSHAGTGRDLARQPSSAEMLEKLKAPLKSTVAIASCKAGQRGLDWSEKRQGVFAYFVAEGLSGSADKDRDLRITAQELFAYLKTNMAAVTISGKSQTPVLFWPR